MARRTETIETLFAQNVKKFLVFASEHGQNKELLEKLYEKFSKTQPKRIELRNRNGNVTYCLVSAEHYEQLNQFKWYRSAGGYVMKNSTDGTNTRMHRYILIDILKRVVAPNEVVDHLDRDPLNNTIENLDIATRIQNAENRSKSKNPSSEYYNVSKIVRKSKITFRVSFKVNDELKLRAYYDIEIHAAHQYNLWFIKYKRKGDRINKIEIPSNFVEYIKIEKRDKDLPIGIWRRGKKFVIQPIINGTQISRSYNSQEQAESELKRMLHEEKIRKLKMIFDTPILRKEGQCVIELFNKKNKKVGETIVDDREYYWLKRFPIWLSKKTVRITVGGKKIILSRYIMKYDGDDCIDHINRNPFKNTKDNLRIATPKQNSQNQTPLFGYIGVYPSKNGKKWVARICVDGKNIHLGTFDNEIKAAKARDVATKKYYGEFGSLNFPDTPRPRRRSI